MLPVRVSVSPLPSATTALHDAISHSSAHRCDLELDKSSDALSTPASSARLKLTAPAGAPETGVPRSEKQSSGRVVGHPEIIPKRRSGKRHADVPQEDLGTTGAIHFDEPGVIRARVYPQNAGLRAAPCETANWETDPRVGSVFDSLRRPKNSGPHLRCSFLEREV